MLATKQGEHTTYTDLAMSFGSNSEDLQSGKFGQILFELDQKQNQSSFSENPGSGASDKPQSYQEACSKIQGLKMTANIYKGAFDEASAKIIELNQIIAAMEGKKHGQPQMEKLDMSGILKVEDFGEDSMFMGHLDEVKPEMSKPCPDCPESKRRIEIFQNTIDDLQRTVEILKTQLKKTREGPPTSNERPLPAKEIIPISNPEQPIFTKKSVDPLRYQRARLPESEDNAAYQRIIRPISGMQLLKEDLIKIPHKAGKLRAMSACAAWLNKQMSEL